MFHIEQILKDAKVKLSAFFLILNHYQSWFECNHDLISGIKSLLSSHFKSWIWAMGLLTSLITEISISVFYLNTKVQKCVFSFSWLLLKGTLALKLFLGMPSFVACCWTHRFSSFLDSLIVISIKSRRERLHGGHYRNEKIP